MILRQQTIDLCFSNPTTSTPILVGEFWKLKSPHLKFAKFNIYCRLKHHEKRNATCRDAQK